MSRILATDYRFGSRISLMLSACRYLRALSAFYIRLTFGSMDIYELLEPLMKDYRKLRVHHVGECSLAT